MLNEPHNQMCPAHYNINQFSLTKPRIAEKNDYFSVGLTLTALLLVVGKGMGPKPGGVGSSSKFTGLPAL